MIHSIIKECHAHGVFDIDDITNRVMTTINEATGSVREGIIREAVRLAIGRCESNFRFCTPIPQKKTTTTQQTVNVTHTRATRIRDAWEKAIDAVVNVDGVRKRLADCTRADVEWLATDLNDRAAAMHNKAGWYESIAARMTDDMTVADITTTSDLLEVA